MDIESENASTDEEVAGSSVQKKGYVCKVTDEDGEAAHDETNDENVLRDPTDLFHDSDEDDLSTGDNMVMDKNNIETGSDNKRKAENDDDHTDGGKKQKGCFKE